MIVYHVTSYDQVLMILADGFSPLSVYRVADRILDANDGAEENAVLELETTEPAEDFAACEWTEAGRGYREWHFAGAVANTCQVRLLENPLTDEGRLGLERFRQHWIQQGLRGEALEEALRRKTEELRRPYDVV